MWIKRLGPGAGFVALMMNSLILIFAIFLRMASTIYKTFRPTNLLSNFKSNFTSVYRLSFQVDRIWDSMNQFDGFEYTKHLFLDTHAWYFYCTWRLLLSTSSLFASLRRAWVLCTRVLQHEFLRHSTRAQRLKDPGERARDKFNWDNYENPMCAKSRRREQRRLRKHHKRYLVHSMSNVMDVYDIFRHGGLRHFNIGNGWFIRFCVGMNCIRHIFGLKLCDEFITPPRIHSWSWTDRPPDTLHEHLFSTIAALLIVVASFSITTFLASMKLRSQSKAGAVTSFFRRQIIEMLPIERPLFIGFLISLFRWWTGVGNLTTLIHITLAVGILDLLHAKCDFNLTEATFSFPGWLFRVFKTWNEPPPRRRIHRRRKQTKTTKRSAHCTVFNVDKRVPSTFLCDFEDTSGPTVICDNSANIHICNDSNLFKSMVPADASKVVATIGGQCNFPKGIGTVTWTWTDNIGHEHTFDVEGVHYFPSSPVNILGVTAFATQLNDEEETGIDTKWKRSRFYWKGGHSRTIYHPPNNLPELPLIYNATNNAFFSYIERCESRNNDSVHFSHSACHSVSDKCTHASPITDVIESTPFEIGERLFYTNEGHTSSVVLRRIESKQGIKHFTVVLPSGDFITTTCEQLRSPDQPDIAHVPVTQEDFEQESKNLTKDQLEELTKPTSLSPEQQELMSYHLRFHHLPFFILHRMAQLGIIPRRLRKLKNNPPHCPSCAFGQAHRKPWRSKRTKAEKEGENVGKIRKKEEDKPGSMVSIDQLISAQPGLVPQTSGHLTAARIWAATIFLDHYTRHIHVHLMRDQSQDSTLEAKAAYERHANTFDVAIKAYRADNGRFAEERFREEIKRCLQDITYCGVGAHHQNGAVERAIKDLTLITRTLLLHAKRHWPEMITTMLWPMALKASEERLNALSLDMDGTTPLSKWSKTESRIFAKDFHTWGCPVFVLDGRLQSNPKGVPKWEPRARVGIFVGHSPIHAGSVALVLNPTTGHVSPQFHVVFDDTFSTVPYMREGTVPPHWAELVRNSSEIATDESFDLSKIWFEGVEDPSELSTIELPLVSQTQDLDTGDTANEGDAIANEGESLNNEPASSNEGAGSRNVTPPLAEVATNPHDPYDNTNTADSESAPFQASEGDSAKMPKMIDLGKSGLRRSPRIIAKTSKLTALLTGVAVFLAGVSHTVLPPVESKQGLSVTQRLAHRYHSVNSNVDGTLNGIMQSVFSSVADNDAYTYSGMLKQPDRGKFVEAMLVETSVHEKRKHWSTMLRKDMPPGSKTILSIWSFKRKRTPDGQISKYKARLCAHGGMQSWGVDYWETYAPVVNWMSVRFILTIAKIHNLDTKVIDFVLAFPQAKLDVDVFMEIPAGMMLSGVSASNQRSMYVLKLNRSLYGLKQASANWYEMLSKGLKDRKFEPSKVDPCVFIGKNSIILCYVDDCIVISRKAGFIDDFIQSLKDGPEQFEFTEEGSLESYLGVKFIDYDNGEQFEMTQPFLIDRIIDAMGIDKRMTNSRPTPAVKPLLHRDLDGEARHTTWNYRSIIGMMNYLQQSTRPDISFAVHQCARFCSDPKLSHERAVKRITKYLLGSKERGVTCRPDRSKGLECYADADFAGGWDRGDSENPENVMSRTGYLLTYAGCPVIWCSKLQTEIALSTMEAEYIALSQAMRSVIPLIQLMDELKEMIPFYNPTPEVRCKLFEDNRSCIIVAESARLTPRTKHIAIKYHHFREYVKSGEVKIFPVSTHEQLADIFTKPLDEGQFKYLRSKFLRW